MAPTSVAKTRVTRPVPVIWSTDTESSRMMSRVRVTFRAFMRGSSGFSETVTSMSGTLPSGAVTTDHCSETSRSRRRTRFPFQVTSKRWKRSTATVSWPFMTTNDAESAGAEGCGADWADNGATPIPRTTII